MPLVQLGRPLLAAIVAVKQGARAIGEENVIGAAALVVIDGVRPGIRQKSFELSGEMLAQLHDQRVVVTVAAGFHAIHAPPSWIDAVDQAITGGGVFAHRFALRVVDFISHRWPDPSDVQVTHRGQMQGPAPDPGDGQIRIARDGVLERHVGLVSIGVAIVCVLYADVPQQQETTLKG